MTMLFLCMRLWATWLLDNDPDNFDSMEDDSDDNVVSMDIDDDKFGNFDWMKIDTDGNVESMDIDHDKFGNFDAI